MALKTIAAAASFLVAVRASEAHACVNGECLNSAESEEASLLAFKTSRTFNLSKWFSGFGISACFNDRGHFFPCGDGQCCGNSCKAKGDLCCRNSLGDSFPCQKDSLHIGIFRHLSRKQWTTVSVRRGQLMLQ